MKSSLLRISLSLFVLNLFAVLGLGWMRRLPPTEDVRVSSTAEHLILYGKNRFGYFSLRQFSSWAQLEHFLEAHEMGLSPLTEAQLQALLDITVEEKKIFWGAGSARKVILTPDTRSAQIISERLRWEGFVPGNFGYSIRVQ
jgi:hypothetical protein